MKKSVLKKRESSSLDAVQLLWGVFRSPAFFLIVMLLAIFWILAGTQVPQNQALSELGGGGSFRWVQLVTAFGLNDVYTSWVLAALGILACLSIVAMVIHHMLGRLDTGWRQGSRWPSASLTLQSENLQIVAEAVETTVGGGRFRQKKQELRLERGLFLESLVVMGLGILTIGITAFLFMAQSISGRVEILSDDGLVVSYERTATTVLKNGEWKKVNLPLALACSHAKREDPLQLRTCRMQTPRGEVEGEIGVGRPLVYSGLSLRLEKMERREGDFTRTFVTSRRSGESGWRHGPADSLLNLDLGGEKETDTWLMRAPSVDGVGWIEEPEELGQGVWALYETKGVSTLPAEISVESSEVLTLAFYETRYRPWFVWGFALFIVGVLSCWLMPHTAVRIVAVGSTECRIEITSINRPRHPENLVVALREKLKDLDLKGDG